MGQSDTLRCTTNVESLKLSLGLWTWILLFQSTLLFIKVIFRSYQLKRKLYAVKQAKSCYESDQGLFHVEWRFACFPKSKSLLTSLLLFYFDCSNQPFANETNISQNFYDLLINSLKSDSENIYHHTWLLIPHFLQIKCLIDWEKAISIK